MQVSHLLACSGVRIACRGSRLDPSPMEANARCFCDRSDLMKPFTTTLLGSAGPVPSRCATEGGRGVSRVEEKFLLLWLRNASLIHGASLGWTIVLALTAPRSGEDVADGLTARGSGFRVWTQDKPEYMRWRRWCCRSLQYCTLEL
jgi:hypothetical protein